MRCFTFPIAPLMVVSMREIEALKKRRCQAGKRSAAAIAAALEEGGSPGHRDGESAQEMRRANQGNQSALSTPWLAQISEPP